jgi:hypothetical protein
VLLQLVEVASALLATVVPAFELEAAAVVVPEMELGLAQQVNRTSAQRRSLRSFPA